MNWSHRLARFHGACEAPSFASVIVSGKGADRRRVGSSNPFRFSSGREPGDRLMKPHGQA